MSAAKVIVSIFVLALLGYIGYSQFSAAPLTGKQAIEEGINQVKSSQKLSAEQEQLLRVQLALTDYVQKHNAAPDALDQLVPDYFESVPLHPKTGEPYAYQRDGRNYSLGDQLKLVKLQPERSRENAGAQTVEASAVDSGAEQAFVNPNTLEIEEFVYNPEDKRDPFLPFDMSNSRLFDESIPPLERYEIGQLKVTAIASDAKGANTAIVEDQSGRGYTVKEGTKIGSSNGVVVSIEKDRVNVVESNVDFTGKENKKPVVMMLDTNKDNNYQKLHGRKGRQHAKKK